MPDGPEKQKAMSAVMAKYPMKLHARASIERDPDKSAVLRLRDPEGRTRILLRAASDGTPSMQFLDAWQGIASLARCTLEAAIPI